MKTRNLLLTFGALTGTAITLDNFGPTKMGCGIYLGQTNTYDTRTAYVFDPLPDYQRRNLEEYALEGDPKLKSSLLSKRAVGNRFCFIYMEPISHLRNGVIRSISQATTRPRSEASNGE